jgi:hypothetical protein
VYSAPPLTPNVLLMLMILPLFCLSMYGIAKRVHKNIPRRWTLIMLSQVSTDMSASLNELSMPALLTRMSMVPNLLTAVSTMAVTSATSPMSARTAIASLLPLLDGVDDRVRRFSSFR